MAGGHNVDVLRTAENRLCARLDVAIKHVWSGLGLAQKDLAIAAGIPVGSGRVAVNRIIKGLKALPPFDDLSKFNSKPRKSAGEEASREYQLIAALSKLIDNQPATDEERAANRKMFADRSSLKALMDDSIRAYAAAQSMFDDDDSNWWLARCDVGDAEAAVVLAERLVWGFALQDDVGLTERQLSPGISEGVYGSDKELAEEANRLLRLTVARINRGSLTAGTDNDGARVAIMSRQILRGYQENPTLRVEFETLANRLLADGWTVGLALSRDDELTATPENRADYVDLLLSDLNHPGVLVPLVDVPVETTDGIYVAHVGHVTIVATSPDNRQAAVTSVSPEFWDVPEDQDPLPAVELALGTLDNMLADRQKVEEELVQLGRAAGPDAAILVGEETEHRHLAIDRFDGVRLDTASEKLARFSVLETVGKLDAGPLYSISPGPSLSLFPPEVTESQFARWWEAAESEIPGDEQESMRLLHHELKLTRLMKNQAFRRNRRDYIHRHLTPLEGLREFFKGEPGPLAPFNNPMYGHRYLDPVDRQAIKAKILRMLDDTIERRRPDRGFYLAVPTLDQIGSLGNLWATITVGARSRSGQIHLVHRTAHDVESNTAVLANLRGVSVRHFGAPHVLMGYLDMLWRQLPLEATNPEKVYEVISSLEVA